MLGDSINTPHPMTIGKAPVLWYDASDSSTITDVSGKASVIRSKGSIEATLTQSTAANRPTISTGWRGNNYLSFIVGASTNYLLKSTVTSGIPTGANPRTLLMAINNLQDNGSAQIAHLFLYGTNTNFQTYGQTIEIWLPAGSVFSNHYWSSTYDTNTSWVGSTYYNFVMQYNGTADYAFINGAPASTPSHSVALNTAANNIAIGANCMGGGEGAYFDFGEFLMYDYFLTEIQRNLVLNYLDNKWKP